MSSYLCREFVLDSDLDSGTESGLQENQEALVDLIEPLDFIVDLTQLKSEVLALVNRVGFAGENQIGLTHTPNCSPENRYRESVGSLYDADLNPARGVERDFSQLNRELDGTYLNWIYQSVPFRPARMRIMRLPARTCLSLHLDTGPRYHIAIVTNPAAFILFPHESRVYHIPANGRLYRMTAQVLHTALNSHPKEERIHLVFSDFERS